MLTEKCLDDSLNDSLQPSQLRSLEAEFETAPIDNYQQQKKPQCSYRYTYSSEECCSDSDNCNQQDSNNQSLIHQSEQQQFQTFGQGEQQFYAIQELISQQNYAEAYQLLMKIQSKYSSDFPENINGMFFFLLMQVYFGLQKYREMFLIAEQLLKSDEHYSENAYDMLIEAALLINNPQLALKYQLQSINKCSQGKSSKEQYRLGKIYLLHNKLSEAYYSFLSSYKNGNQSALEQLVDLGYSIDKSNYKNYALKYIESNDSSNQKVLAKALFILAKEEYPNENALIFQEKAYNLIVVNNGVKDKHTFNCLVNLAELKFQFNHYASAEQDFELALQMIGQIQGQTNSEFLYCLFKISQCQFKENKMTTSIENLEKCLTISQQIQGQKKEFMERIIFNIAYMKIINNIKCSDTLDLLIHTSNPIYLNEIGIILQKYNQTDEAIKLYQLALKESEKEQQVLINLNLAACFGIKKDYQRSVDLYKSCACELEEKLRCDIERKISQVYFACSKFREALFHLKRAFQIAKQFNLECMEEIKQEIKRF